VGRRNEYSQTAVTHCGRGVKAGMVRVCVCGRPTMLFWKGAHTDIARHIAFTNLQIQLTTSMPTKHVRYYGGRPMMINCKAVCSDEVVGDW